jgi:MYXO-CTERM domain-containing protein
MNPPFSYAFLFFTVLTVLFVAYPHASADSCYFPFDRRLNFPNNYSAGPCVECDYPLNSVIRIHPGGGDFVCVYEGNETFYKVNLASITTLDENPADTYFEYHAEVLFRPNQYYHVYLPMPDDGTDCKKFSDMEDIGQFHVGDWNDTDQLSEPVKVVSVQLQYVPNAAGCQPIIHFVAELAIPSSVAEHSDLMQIDVFGRADKEAGFNYLYHSNYFGGEIDNNFPWSIFTNEAEGMVGKVIFIAFQMVDPAGNRSPLSEEVKVTVEKEGCSCASTGAVMEDSLGLFAALGFARLLARRRKGLAHGFLRRREYLYRQSHTSNCRE